MYDNLSFMHYSHGYNPEVPAERLHRTALEVMDRFEPFVTPSEVGDILTTSGYGWRYILVRDAINTEPDTIEYQPDPYPLGPQTVLATNSLVPITTPTYSTLLLPHSYNMVRHVCGLSGDTRYELHADLVEQITKNIEESRPQGWNTRRALGWLGARFLR